jgi:hypothetical protein
VNKSFSLGLYLESGEFKPTDENFKEIFVNKKERANGDFSFLQVKGISFYVQHDQDCAWSDKFGKKSDQELIEFSRKWVTDLIEVEHIYRRCIFSQVDFTLKRQIFRQEQLDPFTHQKYKEKTEITFE